MSLKRKEKDKTVEYYGKYCFQTSTSPYKVLSAQYHVNFDIILEILGIV